MSRPDDWRKWGVLKISHNKRRIQRTKRFARDIKKISESVQKEAFEISQKLEDGALGREWVWDIESFLMKPREILFPGKQAQRVKARSLLCYWAVKEPGISTTSVANKLGMHQSSVSRKAPASRR